MPTVTEDLVAGHRMTDVYGGTSIVRTFRVTNLTAAPHSMLIEARDAQGDGMPDRGDPYPGDPTLTARQIDLRPDPGDPGAVIAEVLYQVVNIPAGGTWNQPQPIDDGQDVKQVSFRTREVATTVDRNGTPMQLTRPASKGFGQEYLSEARILKPIGTLVFERPEASPPVDRLRAYVGTTNSAPLGSYAANTLLMVGFDAQSEDGGNSWRVIYEIAYDPDGWEHRDTWKDESGRAPIDAVEETWDIYAETAYGGLSLDFSDTQTPL